MGHEQPNESHRLLLQLSHRLCEDEQAEVIFERKRRLIAATRYVIDIYNLLNMVKLSSINIDGTLGKLALTPGLSNCYLAYTAGTGNGDVVIYELNKCTKQTTINAYKKPVVQMRFDTNGSLLATACSDVLLSSL